MALVDKIPNFYYPSIFEIDYQMLTDRGITTLFFDLDNTIIPYNEEVIPETSVKFLKQLENNFKIVIVTNNSVKRAMHATNGQFNCVAGARKPFGKGIKEALDITLSNVSHCCLIGDQLQSDILCGNKFLMTTILVNPVDLKSDTLPTKFNRYFEKNALYKIKEKYPELYASKLQAFQAYLEK